MYVMVRLYDVSESTGLAYGAIGDGSTMVRCVLTVREVRDFEAQQRAGNLGPVEMLLPRVRVRKVPGAPAPVSVGTVVA
jgi:hypothetical protein